MGVSPSKTSWLHAQTVVQLRLARVQFHAPDAIITLEKKFIDVISKSSTLACLTRPPGCSVASRTTMSGKRCCNSFAAYKPARPAPTTTTLCVSSAAEDMPMREARAVKSCLSKTPLLVDLRCTTRGHSGRLLITQMQPRLQQRSAYSLGNETASCCTVCDKPSLTSAVSR